MPGIHALLLQQRFTDVRDHDFLQNGNRQYGDGLVGDLRGRNLLRRAEEEAGGFTGVKRSQGVRDVFREINLAGFVVAVGVFKIPDAVEQSRGQGSGRSDQTGPVKTAARYRFQIAQSQYGVP